MFNHFSKFNKMSMMPFKTRRSGTHILTSAKSKSRSPHVWLTPKVALDISLRGVDGLWSQEHLCCRARKLPLKLVGAGREVSVEDELCFTYLPAEKVAQPAEAGT